jgi:hypothetical protein
MILLAVALFKRRAYRLALMRSASMQRTSLLACGVKSASPVW